ncbi:50S ribosomal protein L21 [Niabella defluvii]|nr:50S ribosomal protein L21 [Niabella sp. I65]
MIAVIKVAGQQYKVEKDQTLFVPHLEGKAGDSINLDVLFVHADGKLSVGADNKAKVSAEIVDHIKGDTVIAYKTKRRKGFHKRKGTVPPIQKLK